MQDDKKTRYPTNSIVTVMPRICLDRQRFNIIVPEWVSADGGGEKLRGHPHSTPFSVSKRYVQCISAQGNAMLNSG